MSSKFNPLVSVIIPVYNGADYISEAINSVLAQTYKNIEVVVINDGSSDETEKIVKAYGNKVRYFKKKNGGVATALNMGIERARGNFISWLSHDDLYFEDKLKKQVMELANLKDKNTIIYGNYVCVDADGKKMYDVDLSNYHNIFKLNFGLYAVFRGCLNGCTMLIPKKCFNDWGKFDPKLLTTQDYDLWFRFFKNKTNIRYLNQFFVKSRQHPKQTSRSYGPMIEECNKLWIGMMSQVNEKAILTISGNICGFYRSVLNLFKENGYNKAYDYAFDKLAYYKKINDKKMESEPKISIIIPCYNQGEYLEEAINSVFAQEYNNFEIIVVDDGSTDLKTKKILKRFKRNKVVIYQNKHKGRSSTRNFALSQTTGDFIQFLDCDDYLLEGKLKRQIQLFKDHPENDVVYSNFYYFKDKQDEKVYPHVSSLFINPQFSYNDILLKWQRPLSIPIHTFLFKKSILQGLKFLDNIEICEDWIMWISLAKKGCLFVFDDFVGAVYRLHENNTSTDKKKSFYNALEALKYIRENLVDKEFYEEFDNSALSYINLLTGTWESPKTDQTTINNTKFDIGMLRKIKMIIKRLWKKVLFVLPLYRKMQFVENNLMVQIQRLEGVVNDNIEINKYISLNIEEMEAQMYTIKNLSENFEKHYLESTNLKLEIANLKRPNESISCEENRNVFDEKFTLPEGHEQIFLEFDCDINEYFNKVKGYILKTDIVLDIGCGIRPENFFEPKVHICIEPFEEYRKVIKPFFPNKSQVIFIKSDALTALKNLDNQSVDTVFIVDVIEHLTKEEGLLLINEADRVSRKQVIIFTPLGFYPMHFRDVEGKDSWGLSGIDVQEHKSGWTPDDFDKSWDVYICKNCHEAFLPEEKIVGKKYSAFMAIKTKNFWGFPIQENTPAIVVEAFKRRNH